MASHTRTPLFKPHAQPQPRPHTTARGAPRGLESSCMCGTCSGGRTARRNVDRAGAVLRQSPNWGMRTRKRPSRQCALIYIHRRPGHQTAPPSLPLPLHLGPQLSRVTTTTRLAEPRECGLSHTAIVFQSSSTTTARRSSNDARRLLRYFLLCAVRGYHHFPRPCAGLGHRKQDGTNRATSTNNIGPTAVRTRRRGRPWPLPRTDNPATCRQPRRRAARSADQKRARARGPRQRERIP